MIAIYYARAPEALLTGLAAPFLDGFAEALRDQGYSRMAARRHLRAAAHLGHWAEESALSIRALDRSSLESFWRHLPHCRCGRTFPGKCAKVLSGARRFLSHLEDLGIVARPCAPSSRRPLLLEGFCRFMETHRGATPGTLREYGRVVHRMLVRLGDDPGSWSARVVRDYVFDAWRKGARARGTATAVRAFLRYLVMERRLPAGFETTIPAMASRRLARLPHCLSAGDVQKIVSFCDPGTPSGCRNRAIVLLCARLALRASDIMDLRLADIDWSGAGLRVSGKGRREVQLPLSQEVGDALLDYLERFRPAVGADRVFLTLKSPLGPLSNSTTVSSVVARAMAGAGVKPPGRGAAHLLRHSAASGMLRSGIPLEGIAAVLRHQSTDTTAHYTKIDVKVLRQVVQPWPEVGPC